jgi:hypothetical protein
MPTDGLWSLELDSLASGRIKRLTAVPPKRSAAAGLEAEDAAEALEHCLKAASEDYARCMAAIALRVHGGRHVPGFNQLATFGVALGAAPAPRRPRHLDLPLYDLARRRADFDLATNANIPEAVDALQRAVGCTHDLCRHRSFFLGRDTRRSQTLAEWRDAQERQMDDETAALRQARALDPLSLTPFSHPFFMSSHPDFAVAQRRGGGGARSAAAGDERLVQRERDSRRGVPRGGAEAATPHHQLSHAGHDPSAQRI